MRLAALAVIVACALATESAIGFGATVITVTFAAFLYPVEEILPILVPVNITLSAYLAIRYRDAINWRLLLRRVLPYMGAGFIIGAALFAGIGPFKIDNHRLLRGGFAAFVIVLSAAELVATARSNGDRPARARAGGRASSRAGGRESSRTDGPLLALAGLVHGLYASGGPMVVYVIGRSPISKRSFRATLSALWLVLGCLLVAGYVLKGMANAGTATKSAVLVAPLLAGTALGEWLHPRLNEKTFKTLVFTLLLGAGIFLLVASVGQA